VKNSNLVLALFFAVILVFGFVLVGCDTSTNAGESTSGPGQTGGDTYVMRFSNNTEYTININCDGTPSQFTLYGWQQNFTVTKRGSSLIS
jgi:hypothetical protein